MFEEYIARALAIRAEIERLRRDGPVIIGFPFPSLIDDAYQALRKLDLRKPFLASKKEWTRSTIIHSERAYKFLWTRVELRFLADDGMRLYRGDGTRSDTRPPQADIYWEVVLEAHFTRFASLLRG